MKTFHEWLAMREGLWLNDKNAVIGMWNINPLLQKNAKVKPLKLPKAKLVSFARQFQGFPQFDA